MSGGGLYLVIWFMNSASCGTSGFCSCVLVFLCSSCSSFQFGLIGKWVPEDIWKGTQWESGCHIRPVFWGCKSSCPPQSQGLWQRWVPRPSTVKCVHPTWFYFSVAAIRACSFCSLYSFGVWVFAVIIQLLYFIQVWSAHEWVEFLYIVSMLVTSALFGGNLHSCLWQCLPQFIYMWFHSSPSLSHTPTPSCSSYIVASYFFVS